MKDSHNQQLGFEVYANKNQEATAKGLNKKKTKRKLKEVTIDDAKRQLLQTGKIKRIIAVIGAGKEATVLLAEDNEEKLVCAKIFRYFTSTIKKRLYNTKHLLPMDMAMLAAQKEYWNLYEMKDVIPVPRPQLLIKNIVIMDFIPEKDGSIKPAPLLRSVRLSKNEAEDFLHEAVDILATLFIKGHFVHGDYSEHNLMVTYSSDQPSVLITMDVSQSVEYNQKTFIDTPIRIRIDKALDYLKTDLENINSYFLKNYHLGLDISEVVIGITNKLPTKLQKFLGERTMEIYPVDLMPIDSFIGKERLRTENVYKRRGVRRQKPK